MRLKDSMILQFNRFFTLLLFNLSFQYVIGNRPPRFLLEGQSEVVLRLKESPITKVGTLIYTLKGFDPDGDPIVFGVRNSPDSAVIKVKNLGNNEAAVYLSKELDRETKDEYSIVLTLTDNHFAGNSYVSQSFLLLVEDINDNEPIFKQYQSAVEVLENSKPGVIAELEATDQDEGAYGQVVYYLNQPDGDNNDFTITTSNGKGVIRLVGRLDYERKTLYQLRILAIDRSHQEPINTGTATILVKVKDVEDMPPEFVQAIPVSRVPEDTIPGSQILRVRAVDGDRGINNKVKYFVDRNSHNSTGGLFSIEEDTGIIYTKRALDREDNTLQVNGAMTLTILAIEVSKINPAPYVKTEITIIITDVNDEIPTFRKNFYHCQVEENAQIYTPLRFIDNPENFNVNNGMTNLPENEVSDHDLGQNGTFNLFIDPPNDVFEISPSLVLNEAHFIIRVKNSRVIDYEKFTNISFNIVAREIGNPNRSSSVSVQVLIQDQNDNLPEFEKSIYEVTIPENCEVGTTVVQVRAYDKDSGDYGTLGIRYTNITGSIAHLLQLDPLTGIVTFKSRGGSFLDREILDRHYFTVEARDNVGQGNRNSVQMVLNIEDANDNAPKFIQSRYEATLLENNLDFEIPVKVEARDDDLLGTANSQITYDIVDGQFSNNFTIDAKTGVLKPRTIVDFEALSGGTSNVRPVVLTIRATDGGIPRLTAKVQIIIFVHDVNDNPPIFEKMFYSRTIPENMPGGTAIIEIKAIDNDGSAQNNLIVFRIQNGASDKFVISPDTGIISVAHGASLDPDLTSPRKLSYIMTVVAFDNGIGEKQLTASTILNVTIKDVNNKAPVFAELKIIEIHENTAVGTQIYKLTATDLDSNPILRYKIIANNSEGRTEEGAYVKSTEYDFIGAFECNALDGTVRIVKIIDRERIETIKLCVAVQDMAASSAGDQIDTACLNIIVKDENDNNPKFKRPFYKKAVTENSFIGVSIVTVVAYDVDKNKTVNYSLEGDTSITDLIHLDSETGEIVVANKIDHESFLWLNFTVRGTDSGYPSRSSFVDVFISVLDENDNNPYFISSVKNFTISENAAIGTRIGVIQALDADSGDFGKVTFLMDRLGSQGKFSIDADTGVLTVTEKLDREIKDSYVLVIEAWDNYQFGFLSGESRNAFKQIYVNILDENDSPPEVELPNECVQITEYHNPSESIVTMKGRDADDNENPNGRLEFSISSLKNESLFYLSHLDPWTARLFANDSLQNKHGNYSLSITVKDLGIPANVVKKKLFICVADFNDHPPIFIFPVHNATVRVAENTTIGTLIIQVQAIDEDVGANAAIRYRLRSDPLGNFKSFKIDAETGEIFLNQELDRETQKIYEIRIEASDQGLPTSLSSDLDLTVYVRNVNEYEPQFLVEQISVNFTEHQKPGMQKVKLPDTIDRDEVNELDDPPSTVCYFIVHGNEDNRFLLDPRTHILSIQRELDREMQENHTLFIRATENCNKLPSNLSSTPSVYKKYESSNVNNKKNFAVRQQISFDRYAYSRKLRSVQENGTFLPFSIDNENLLLLEDSTIVRVVVYVQDINDNPPKFLSKIFTGGFTTDADFGTKFMTVKAIDIDVGQNSVVRYYKMGKIKRTLSEGLENIQETPFLIDAETGEIQLNFDPQKGMKGYFDFMIMANDTGDLKDFAHVYIYLLREDQKVRFVFRQQPTILRENIHVFRDTLSRVTGTIVNIDEFKIHENKDGSVDRTKTDLYMHLVHNKDNSIFDVPDVLKIIDQHIEQLDGLFKEFNVLDTQPAEAELLVANFVNGPMMIWLVFSNLFVAILLFITLIVCTSQRTNYRRQLRAAKVNIYATHFPPDVTTDRGPATRVPNTNKHSVEGSNPIWLKGFENEYFSQDENRSENRPSFFDENAISNENDPPLKPARLFDRQNDLNRHFNVYHQIDKLTAQDVLAKKLETTEL